MEITPAAPLSIPGAAAPRAGAAPLQAGQVLQARLLAVDGDGVLLAVGERGRLWARGRLALPVGSEVRLLVTHEHGQWRLQPIQDAGSRLLQALRESLPQARAWSALFPRLDPPPENGAWARLWAALPRLAQLTDPGGLARALGRAGLNLERRLSQGAWDAQDLKGLLLALLAEDPEDEGLRGAVERLRLEQAQHLLDPDRLTLPLPFLDPRGRPAELELRWRRRARAGGGEEHVLHLRLDLPRLGPCHARLCWDGRLAVDLWAERPATWRLFQGHLESLDGRLREAGLPLQRLDAHQGRPKTGDEKALARHLLDLRA